ncbi:MAG: nucleotidyltransferase domain-containing protein [bacterium]|nr:nucleotidyltransferase domain-containing protein [bacterium]
MSNNNINLMVNTLDKKPYISFAYLFGSRANECANKRSDWDTGIYFSKSPDDISKWCVFELEAELSKDVKAEVQVIVLNKLTSPLFGFQIINEGILLVQRDENDRIKFENRILRQYHDWQYFLKRQIEAEKAERK